MSHTIELSENSIKILNRQDLTEDSIVFVEVDTSYMPPSRASEWCDRLRETFEPIVSPAKLVIHTHQAKITMITQKIQERNS